MLLTCVLWFLVVQRYRYLLENGEKGGSAVRQYGLGVSSSRVTAEPVRVFSRRERRFSKGFPLIGASAYDWEKGKGKKRF
jgi:hypothetical protein